MTSTLTPATHRASFAHRQRARPQNAWSTALTEMFVEGAGGDRRVRAAGRPLGRHRAFRRRAGPGRVRGLVAHAAGDDAAQTIVSTPSRPRTGSRPAWKSLCRSPPAASSSTASTTAHACRRTSSASRSRPRWPSAPAITAPRAAACCCSTRCSRRCRRAACSISAPAPACWRSPRPRRCITRAGERHRSAVGARRARQRAAQRPGIWCEVIRATGFSAPAIRQARAVRPGAGEHPRQSAAATGGADGAASGAVGAGDPVRPADAAGHGVIAAYRARGLVPLRHIRIDGWSSLLLQNADQVDADRRDVAGQAAGTARCAAR